MDDIELVGFRPELRAHFERLNRSWLEAHSLLEPADLEHLQHPEEHILAVGGEVFFAVRGEDVVGTCAAIPVSPVKWELAKLTVDASARGRGLGRRLCETVVSYARERGATEVFLTSNTALVAAIHIYESLGFVHEALPADIRYQTADVYMRLVL